MRTIIINTLGQALTQNPLFFLPFPQDQMFWLERDLGAMDACAQEIRAICDDQFKRQDYHLVVLADPVAFHLGDTAPARKCYQKLILALLNRNLLQPLLSQSNLVPQAVSVVFLVSRQTDRSLGTAILDHVFGISPQDQPITALKIRRTLPGGAVQEVDVSGLFQNALADHQSKVQARQESNESLDDPLVYDNLIQALGEDLDAMQHCSYVPAGATKSVPLSIQVLEFIPRTTVPDLIWADLQLGLCDHLAGQILHPSRDSQLILPAHTQEDLEQRLCRAQSRVDALLGTQYRPRYYPLVNQPHPTDIKSLTADIWTALDREAQTLPGVAEAKLHRDHPDPEQAEGPTDRLKQYWIRVSKEKELFHQLCTRLDSEYSQDLVDAQQRSILDICARTFREQRSIGLTRKPKLPKEATEPIQPPLDLQDHRKRLMEAQDQCTRASAEKLADFSDVRQEAEVIKARFRKAGRFWAPQKGPTATFYFQMYSGILALIFLAQILLPYLGITLGQAGVSVDRLVHFLLSILVFAGLYGLGLLAWLRDLCTELHGYSEDMSRLIWESARRREDSIVAAVEAYSTTFPECMRLCADLRELEYIHRANEAIKTNYLAHLDLLQRAQELLQNLCTQLQISSRSADPEKITLTRGLDYTKAPGHSRNLAYYTLLSDEWGDG